MNNIENTLAEIEGKRKIKKPISFFSIGFAAFFSIFFFCFGIAYYNMWKDYGNPERIKQACVHFFTSGFMLATTISHLLVRYNFIRRGDLKTK